MKTAVNYPDESSSAAPSRSFARYFPAIVRILLGASLLIFGLNGFFNFMPPPKTPLPEGAMTFVTALAKSGYMMQLIAVTQLVVGALLVANRFVPFAILLLAPFLVNSLAFHLFLERSGLVMSAVFCALEIYLAWVYRRAYAPLFVARTSP